MPDTTNYRNLALLRPAYHSSSYDYNLTAQLVTDGIKTDRLPQWIVVSDVSQGPVSKENREVIVDHAPMNTMELRGLAPRSTSSLPAAMQRPRLTTSSSLSFHHFRHRQPHSCLRSLFPTTAAHGL